MNLTVLSFVLSFVRKEICESHELSIDVELDVTHIPIAQQKGDVCFHHPNAVHLKSQILTKNAKKIEQDRKKWKMEEDIEENRKLKPEVVNINRSCLICLADSGEGHCGWAPGKVRINGVDFLQICSLSQKNGQFARSVNGRDPWLC